MKKFLCLSALMGVLLTSGGIVSATEALNLDVPEDHTAIYGGGMEATEEGFSSSKLRYAAGGGDFNCGVNGFKVYANYYHARAKHSATAKNGRGGQVRSVQKAGVRAYATCNATLTGNIGWWNVY